MKRCGKKRQFEEEKAYPMKKQHREGCKGKMSVMLKSFLFRGENSARSYVESYFVLSVVVYAEMPKQNIQNQTIDL